MKILIFFTFASKFWHLPRYSSQVSPHKTYILSLFICKRNWVNWTKSERVRAVFVEEVQIHENKPFPQNRNFQRFGGNFDLCDTGLVLEGLTPFFVMPNNCLSFRMVPCSLNPDFWVRKSKIPWGANPPAPVLNMWAKRPCQLGLIG